MSTSFSNQWGDLVAAPHKSNSLIEDNIWRKLLENMAGFFFLSSFCGWRAELLEIPLDIIAM